VLKGLAELIGSSLERLASLSFLALKAL